MVFSLHGQPEIRDALTALNKKDLVLIGQQTDVCVAQSAIDLVDAGYRVWVADDAPASPGPHHDSGLFQMRDAGVVVSGIKGIYYEWLRDVPSAIAMESTVRDTPSDLTL